MEGAPGDGRCECTKKDGSRCHLPVSKKPGDNHQYCARFHQACQQNFFARAVTAMPTAIPTGAGGTVPFGQVMEAKLIQPPPPMRAPPAPVRQPEPEATMPIYPPVARPYGRGDIRTAKLPMRKGKWPDIPGFARINVTSSAPGRTRDLSPMLIGPFEVVEPLAPNDYYPNGIHPGFAAREVNGQWVQVALVWNIENYWQGSKIFQLDIVNGVLQRSFFERRAAMFAKRKGERRALPKTSGVPISSYYGQIMDYIESRLRIYCPLYARLVQTTSIFNDISIKVGSGTNMLILDYDSRNIGVITEEGMLRELLREDVPFGHGMVLACVLLGMAPWETLLNQTNQ
jgi:hypothetical protein